MNSKQRHKDKKLQLLAKAGREAHVIQRENEHLLERTQSLEQALSSKEELLATFREQVRSASSSSQELTHTLQNAKEQHQHETNSIQELLHTATTTLENQAKQIATLRTANRALHTELDQATELAKQALDQATADLRRQVQNLKTRLIEPDKLRRRLHAKQEEIEKLCSLISDYRRKLGLPPDEYHPFTRQIVRNAQAQQAPLDPSLIPIDPATGDLLPGAHGATVAFAHAQHPEQQWAEQQWEKLPPAPPAPPTIPVNHLNGIPVDGVVLDEAQTYLNHHVTIPQSED